MFACVNCLGYLFFLLLPTIYGITLFQLNATIYCGQDICCSQHSNAELIYQIIKLKIPHLKI